MKQQRHSWNKVQCIKGTNRKMQKQNGIWKQGTSRKNIVTTIKKSETGTVGDGKVRDFCFLYYLNTVLTPTPGLLITRSTLNFYAFSVWWSTLSLRPCSSPWIYSDWDLYRTFHRVLQSEHSGFCLLSIVISCSLVWILCSLILKGVINIKVSRFSLETGP